MQLPYNEETRRWEYMHQRYRLAKAYHKGILVGILGTMFVIGFILFVLPILD